MGVYTFWICPLDTLQPGALCGRTLPEPSSCPAFPRPAQRSVPLSASRGHQSLRIARWRLLETKEEDFGCQFVLTLCKVCLEAEEAIYRPESGCALLWLFWCYWLGTDGHPRPKVMGASFWCLLYLGVKPMGPVVGRRGPWSKPFWDRRLPLPLPHTACLSRSLMHQRDKVSEKTRPVRMTGKAKGRGQEERNRMQARGKIKNETEKS